MLEAEPPALDRLLNRLGVRTTSSAEWGWAVVRYGLIAIVGLGTFLFLKGTFAFPIALGLQAFATAYGVFLISLLRKGRTNQVFVIGLVLDNICLAISWWAFVQAEASALLTNDLYFAFIPVISVGAARLGTHVGAAYAGLWIAMMGMSWWSFPPQGGYDVQHLYLRLLLLGVSAGATLLLVGWWNRERQQVEELLAETTGREQEVRSLRDRLHATLEAQNRQLAALDKAVASLGLSDSLASLQSICESARAILGVRYGALAMWSVEGQPQAFFAAGLADGTREGIRPLSPSGLRLLTTLNQYSDALRLKNPDGQAGSPGTPFQHPEMRSVLAVPIRTRGASLGALYVGDEDADRDYTSMDEQVLRLYAGFAGVSLDNVHLYEEVQAERSTLAAVQSSMTEGLAVVGEDGRVQAVNDAALRMLNLTRAEVVGQDAEGVIRRVSARVKGQTAEEEHLVGMYRERAATSDRQGPVAEVEIEEPERRILQISTFPIKAASGQVLTGFLVRDVTTEKEALRRRDEFVSIASHELRTPMTVVLGYSELLLTRRADEKAQREWATRIFRDSERLVTILDDLLDFSRITSGRMQIENAPVDITRLVREETDKAGRLTDIHEIAADIEAGVTAVWGDEGRVRQVLINLLTNAIKYSPKGGPISMTVRRSAASPDVVVSVADKGIGIAPEDMRTLFTQFQRIARPETQGIRGTGLGLYIVAFLMGMMGGRVWVESRLNEGTTFYLAFRSYDDALTCRDEAG